LHDFPLRHISSKGTSVSMPSRTILSAIAIAIAVEVQIREPDETETTKNPAQITRFPTTTVAWPARLAARCLMTGAVGRLGQH
jgi:hypothetical protein